eukprot:Colp12_sorted_trinity150504_noHs@35661
MAQDPRPTAEELQNFSKACQRVWELDVNRMVPGKDYALNLQCATNVGSRVDKCDEKLFKFVNKDKFFSIPTYKSFYALLDNYVRETGQAEVVTNEELRENSQFLDACLQTPVMKYVHRYLVAKHLASANLAEFK